MIQVCTVTLENIIKNFVLTGIDVYFQLSYDSEAGILYKEQYIKSVRDLLSSTESNIVNAIRMGFNQGYTKHFLSIEDYNQITRMREEGQDFCIRVLHGNETLCILSKKEIK